MPTNKEVLQTLLNLDCPELIASEMINDINLDDINHQALFFLDSGDTNRNILAYCHLHDLNKKQIHKSDSFIMQEATELGNGECNLSFNHIAVGNLNALKKSPLYKGMLILKREAISVAKHFDAANEILAKLAEINAEADKKKAGASYA